MKKFTSILMLLLACVGTAWAQAQESLLPDGVQASTEANPTFYHMRSAGASKNYYATINPTATGDQVLGSANNFTATKTKASFIFVAVTDQQSNSIKGYNIKVKIGDKFYFVGLDRDGTRDVEVKAKTTTPTISLWKFIKHGTDGTQWTLNYSTDNGSTWKAGSWNMHGGPGNNLKTYDAGDQGSLWLCINSKNTQPVYKSDLNNDQVYILESGRSNASQKEYLIYDAAAANYVSSTWGEYGSKNYDRAKVTTDPNAKWVIYQGQLGTYFYNVGAQKFIGKATNNGGHQPIPMTDNVTCPSQIYDNGTVSGYKFILATNGWAVNVANISGSHGVVNWENYNSHNNDNGNCFKVLPAEIGTATVDFKAIGDKVLQYELSIKKPEAKQWAAAYKGKIGYPTDAALTTFNNAVDAAKSFSDIETAKNTLYASTDINLPVEGKAYTIKAHFHDNSEQKLYWNGTKIANGANPATTNSDVFICRKVGTDYVFVNNYGKYLIWFDSGDAGKSLNVNGVTDTYTDSHNKWTLSHASVSGGTNYFNGGTTEANFFGLIAMQAPNKSNTKFYLAARKDGAFISSNPLDKWYDQSGNGSRSFAFRFEEVAYPINPTLNAIEGNGVTIAGATHIATFSAPFATVIPTSVKAYYVKQDGMATSNVAYVTPIEGTALPANEGVILTGTQGGAVTMLPATTETAAVLTNNQLGHSAGADKDMANETTDFYVLTKVGAKVGFFKGSKTANTVLKMNKSYLKAQGQGASQAIQLVFDGTTTGVEETLTNAATQLPVYDLSGRRAMQPLKKGIYIQGGKKFIVK